MVVFVAIIIHLPFNVERIGQNVLVMKKITLPSFKTLPNPPGCCSNSLIRDLVFPEPTPGGCCGEQTYPMTPPETIPGDYLDTGLTPYTVLGTCDSTLVFSVTYDRILDDPFFSTDVYWNGNPIGLTPGGSVSITVSPGDQLFFIAIMGITGMGQGVFTFRVINQTCGEVTPTVVFVATLGA